MGQDEMGGALSRDEIEVGMRRDTEDKWWRHKRAARSVLRRELDAGSISFAELRRDPTRGEVAAKLFDTWAAGDRSEAIIETAYSVTGIYEDLRAAMNAQGLSTFDERCLELGRKVVEAAVEYVLDCHTTDAEAVEADLEGQ